jgi:hypothetical protein
MQEMCGSKRRRASRIVASLFGALAGIGGVTHGVGEVLQGNVRAEGIFIYSWTQGPIATNMGGEPGISLVPNLLITGILTLLVSATILAWATFAVERKNGGWALIILSTILLLVGGGIGPPIIGVLAGVAGVRGNATPSDQGGYQTMKMPRSLARVWPLLFAVASVSGSLLVVGSLILVYFFGVDNADLFLNLFYLTVLSLLFTVLLSPVYERQKHEQRSLALD